MSALETLADKAQAASRRLAAQGGLKAKLGGELAADAAFVRKLRPALIKQRATRRRPTAPTGPPLGDRPTPTRETGGPNPFLVVGAALVLGVAVARWIDWRSHAHPRG